MMKLVERALTDGLQCTQHGLSKSPTNAVIISGGYDALCLECLHKLRDMPWQSVAIRSDITGTFREALVDYIRSLCTDCEKVEAPDAIGRWKVGYSSAGASINGTLEPVCNLKRFLGYLDNANMRDGNFGAWGITCFVRDGHIQYDHYRLTTAQLAAMIEKCEAIAAEEAKKPKTRKEKRWQVQHIGTVFTKYRAKNGATPITFDGVTIPEDGNFLSEDEAILWMHKRAKSVGANISQYSIHEVEIEVPIPATVKKW